MNSSSLMVTNIFFLLCAISQELMCNKQWDGAGYDKNSSPQLYTARTLLKDIELKNFRRILDIGCGNGAITSYIASQTSAIVLGTDSSEEMITFASATYSASNLTFEIQDISTWQLPKDTFDLIVSFNCLHWIGNLSTVMKRISASLQAGGQFITALAHPGHFLYNSFKKTIMSPEWRSRFSAPEREPWYPQDIVSMQGILHEAGLEVISLYVWDKELEFTSTESFITWLSNWMGGIGQVSELNMASRKEFITQTAHAFLETITIKPDGSFTFRTPVLIAHAKKE